MGQGRGKGERGMRMARGGDGGFQSDMHQEDAFVAGGVCLGVTLCCFLCFGLPVFIGGISLLVIYGDIEYYSTSMVATGSVMVVLSSLVLVGGVVMAGLICCGKIGYNTNVSMQSSPAIVNNPPPAQPIYYNGGYNPSGQQANQIYHIENDNYSHHPPTYGNPPPAYDSSV